MSGFQIPTVQSFFGCTPICWCGWLKWVVHWGCEIGPLENWNHSNSGHFEISGFRRVRPKLYPGRPLTVLSNVLYRNIFFICLVQHPCTVGGWNTGSVGNSNGRPLFGFPMAFGFPVVYHSEQNGNHFAQNQKNGHHFFLICDVIPNHEYLSKNCKYLK